MQIAVLLCLCEGELEMARDVSMSLLGATPGHTCWFQIVDDGSPSRVGERLLSWIREAGADGQVHRLDASLGFRGCSQRTCLGLEGIASSGRAFDLVVKTDPDTLVVGGTQLGEFLERHGVEPSAMWGSFHVMRKRDRVLLGADLLPLGFRRRANGQVLSRAWELKRARPVWWSRFGWKALASGRFRFRHPCGGFYTIAGDLVREMHRRGYLKNAYAGRHGFVSSEEDLIATLLCVAVGGRVRDFDEVRPAFADLCFQAGEGYGPARARNHVVLHPIKNTPEGRACRADALGTSLHTY